MRSLTLTPLVPAGTTLEEESAAVSTATSLRAWTESEAFEPSGTITRNANGVPTSFSVVWPDGSQGLFTATTLNAATGAVDAYTITHTSSDRVVTQAAVTRNASGAVSSKPRLTVVEV